MKTRWILLVLLLRSGIASAQTFDVDTLQFSGSTNQRINLVILGDGYQEPELPQFVSNAEDFLDDLFQETPYKSYRDYFNVFLIKTPSNVSGAAMHPDSLIDNYYGSTYWYAGIERLLAPVYTGKVISVLTNNFPNYDQVFLLVNHTKYGGSGGWVATASLHALSSEIAIHEIGHSFANLKDEYWAGDSYAAERANMTKQTDPQQVKWKNWYGENGIGIYQHCCGGNAALWYRPHENCKMRNLNQPFCSVCREQTVESIHSKVGTLVTGFSPVSTNVIPLAFPLRFDVSLLKPAPNTLHLEWVLNSKKLSSIADSVLVTADSLKAGVNVLTVQIEDTTQLLRVNNHSNIHLYQVSWTITYSPTSIPEIEATTSEIRLEVFPNPASTFVQLELQTDSDTEFYIELISPSGRMVQKMPLLKSKLYTMNTEKYPAGVYSMALYSNGQLLTTKKFVKL